MQIGWNMLYNACILGSFRAMGVKCKEKSGNSWKIGEKEGKWGEIHDFGAPGPPKIHRFAETYIYICCSLWMSLWNWWNSMEFSEILRNVMKFREIWENPDKNHESSLKIGWNMLYYACILSNFHAMGVKCKEKSGNLWEICEK